MKEGGGLICPVPCCVQWSRDRRVRVGDGATSCGHCRRRGIAGDSSGWSSPSRRQPTAASQVLGKTTGRHVVTVRIRPYPTTATEDTVQTLCDPDGEPLKPARQCMAVHRFDDEMDVVVLNRELENAQP